MPSVRFLTVLPTSCRQNIQGIRISLLPPTGTNCFHSIIVRRHGKSTVCAKKSRTSGPFNRGKETTRLDLGLLPGTRYQTVNRPKVRAAKLAWHSFALGLSRLAVLVECSACNRTSPWHSSLPMQFRPASRLRGEADRAESRF